MSYVLWRVANGWLVTYGSTIWEAKCAEYMVFKTLREFADYTAALEGDKRELKRKQRQ